MTGPRHPARFSRPLLPLMAQYLHGAVRLLDPFGGIGTVAEMKNMGVPAIFHVNEIEPEWASQALGFAHVVSTADARALPFPDGYFDAVCTSPAYGNRLADHCTWRDSSLRHTYKSALGRSLSSGNAGRLQWGPAYRKLHSDAWAEVYRVTAIEGLFVLNISDHIRLGEVQEVTAWHLSAVLAAGFALVESVAVPTARLRYGAHAKTRVGYESIIVFRKEEKENRPN